MRAVQAMCATVKRRAADALGIAVELGGLLLSASGGAVAAFFGKLALALVLGAVALGCLLRLARRRRSAPRGTIRR